MAGFPPDCYLDRLAADWNLIVDVADLAVFVALFVALDQAVKSLAKWRLAPGMYYGWSGRLGLRLVANRRAGIMRLTRAHSAALWLIAVGGVALALSIVGTLPTLGGVGLGMVVGGATSNLIDKLVRGAVVDFVAVGGWSTFNLADAAMVAGAAAASWSVL